MPNLDFFDVNCMIGKWPMGKLKFSTVKELISEMDYYGIKRAMVFHSLAWRDHPKVGNRIILEEVGDSARLFCSWVLLPSATEELEKVDDLIVKLLSEDIRAVRVFPKDHNFRLLDWSMGDILSALEDIRTPILIDNSQIELDELFDVCKRHPALPVILTCMEYRNSRMLYALLKNFHNLYVEISTYLTYRGIEDIVDKFGAERLLFGTRMPFQEPGISLAAVNYAQIGEKEKKMIAGKNMERLLEERERCR